MMSIFNVKQWSYNHFNNGLFGDSHRTECVIEVASDMARCSGKSIALSCGGNEANVEGAYLLVNARFGLASIMIILSQCILLTR
jgi:hypothetical protein